jgi:glycosyltransferase involved in cell wall biosynthesis
MKVCLIGNPESIHFIRWARGLKERGITIQTVSIDYSGIVNGIPHQKFHYKKIPFGNSLWRKMQFESFLKRIDADIFHLHMLFYTSHIRSILKMNRVVITPYGSEVFWDLSSRRQKLKRMLIERAHLMTASSQFLLDAIRNQGFHPVNQKRIYFGVDLKRFRSYKKMESKPFRIGFVKHLIDYYGVHILFEASRKLIHLYPEMEFHFYGEGPLKETLKKTVQSLKLQSRLYIHGAVPYEDLPGIYHTLDVFVMPTLCREAFGVSAVEAQACGLPVIASRIGGIPETLKEGKTGFLVEPGNTDELAGKIEILYKDSKLRKQMAKEAVQWSRRFDWQISLDEMIQVYEELM